MWLTREPWNIYPRKINSYLVPRPPPTNRAEAFSRFLLLVLCYFGTSRGKEIVKTCPSTSIASSNSEVRSGTESNNSKKRGQYGKYTPEQKAMIGKRAAEHGVVAKLCIPDRFMLVVTLQHTAFTSKQEAIALRMHEGCGLYLTRPHFFYHESLQIRASTKILPTPPQKKYLLYGM